MKRVLLFFGGRQEAGFDDLQVVILGELTHEVKRHRLDLAQLGIDHHRLDAIDDGRTHVGRILEVRIAPATFGIETGHHSTKALGPIAGSKLFSITGQTVDEKFTFWCRIGFNGIGHVIGLP